MKKSCLECHALIFGRIDKKFCDDLCRTAYHNKRLRCENPEKKRVENILKKNWKILKRFSNQQDQPSIERLRAEGFDFKYFTQSEIVGETMVNYKCFDIFYRIEKSQLPRKETIKISPFSFHDAFPES